ncbi:uncharacterized protein LOC134648640 [Cydia amplana]|uniref:uncharacterized protein LOC134648640 n=1 Tax=Cydia amplana TaxID=1869771 RepID=UPI002FE6C344
MEQTAMQNISFQPKTMAELLPNLALNGILSKEALLTLTGKKKPRNTMAINRTAEKAVKPLTMAEMRAELQAFKGRTPCKAQPALSTRKKGWNSSVKVDKRVNHTVDGKLRNNVVRKVLIFQPPKPVAPVQNKTISNGRVSMMPPARSRMTSTAAVSKTRMTPMPPETPKFPKPEHRAKKSLYIQAKTNVRISGICDIPETPVETKPAKPRVTIANKENRSCQANVNRKSITPTLINHKRLAPPPNPKPDTPLSNDSWKSGSDASFIQKEKEIHETEAITAMQNISFQPKTMAELLPNLALNGILSKEAILRLTGKKKPRNTMAINRTAEKAVKPLTMAEMRAELQAFKGRTPCKAQPAPSTRKKGWNSSVKVDKRVNHTADGKLRNNVVRKVLNFQPPKPVAPVQNKTISNGRVSMMPPARSRMTSTAAVSKARMTPMPPETPKFPKPEHRAKKSLYIQAKTNVRISGICDIPETPVETKPAKPRVTIANKENRSCQANVNRKSITPTLINHKRLAPPPKPDTPLSNDSWESGSDASFIQKEKEIHETEAITNAILDAQHTLENIVEVSPPIATPFREYRNNIEYTNSSVMDNSNSENDTIMCFDNPTMVERVNNQDERLKESEKVDREESVIVSLCDMLNKATVTNFESSSKLELREVERQTEHNIKMIKDNIPALINIIEAQYKTLSHMRKLIRDIRNGTKVSDDKDKTLVGNSEPKSPPKSPVLGRPCSVIRLSPKSPSYKIPKRTPCLRKRVFYKSMPNVVSDMSTPVKLDAGTALNMYMEMKEQLHFLNTPLVKARPAQVPDTPAITSQNLQMQLNRLYNRS